MDEDVMAFRLRRDDYATKDVELSFAEFVARVHVALKLIDQRGGWRSTVEFKTALWGALFKIDRSELRSFVDNTGRGDAAWGATYLSPEIKEYFDDTADWLVLSVRLPLDKPSPVAVNPSWFFFFRQGRSDEFSHCSPPPDWEIDNMGQIAGPEIRYDGYSRSDPFWPYYVHDPRMYQTLGILNYHLDTSSPSSINGLMDAEPPFDMLGRRDQLSLERAKQAQIALLQKMHKLMRQRA